MPFRKNIDIDLLRGFVTIVELGSFTRAAARLMRTQSAISLQVKRLEEQVGDPVFERGGRGVKTTRVGDMLLDYARRILAVNDELVARLAEPDVAGPVRIGAPDDFAALHLAPLLARFARAFPRVELMVECGHGPAFRKRYEADELDLLFADRAAGDAAGQTVWREPLAWAAATADALPPELPLISGAVACAYRALAVAALDRAGRPWRQAYVSPSWSGARAAAGAGLGVALLPRSLLSDGVRALPAEQELPAMPDMEIQLLRREGLDRAASRLADFVVGALETAGQRARSASH